MVKLNSADFVHERDRDRDEPVDHAARYLKPVALSRYTSEKVMYF
jgi:hypothetical protein